MRSTNNVSLDFKPTKLNPHVLKLATLFFLAALLGWFSVLSVAFSAVTTSTLIKIFWHKVSQHTLKNKKHKLLSRISISMLINKLLICSLQKKKKI